MYEINKSDIYCCFKEQVICNFYKLYIFKQFNPNKPAKYGLLFKSINAAKYPYTFVSARYVMKMEVTI